LIGYLRVAQVIDLRCVLDAPLTHQVWGIRVIMIRHRNECRVWWIADVRFINAVWNFLLPFSCPFSPR
jgi:hypothetical protein